MKKIYLNILLILAASAAVQLLLILYKHYIGYVKILNPLHFGAMLLVGTLMTAAFMALILPVNMKLIRLADARAPWKKSIPLRLTIEFSAVLLIGMTAGLVFTVAVKILFGYDEPLGEVILNNMFITAVINLIAASALEAVIFYRKNREAQHKAEALERENLQMRFQMLKRQLDPHFLFNSLNILSSLIRSDSKKSQDFIDAFSAVYRYTLDVIDKPVVSLREEIEFARDYLFLQKLRFEDGFVFDLSVDESCQQKFLPPLALQILLENVFKHNSASKKNPLQIRIFAEEGNGMLAVVNNLQPRGRMNVQRGVGIENLRNRYALISEILPVFHETKNEYIAKLPLIDAD